MSPCPTSFSQWFSCNPTANATGHEQRKARPSRAQRLQFNSFCKTAGASLRMQGLPWWLSGKILPCLQGTRVRSLVREDPTRHGESESMCHKYRSPGACGAHTLQKRSPTVRSPRITKKSRVPQLETVHTAQKDPEQPKINKYAKLF